MNDQELGGIPERGLKPAGHYGKKRPHGDRLRYLGGCHCRLCRAANSAYESYRAKMRRIGLHNGIIDAANTRRALKALRRRGVGLRGISQQCDISRTVLTDIVTGRKKRIRAETERRVLAVVPEQVLPDGAYIDAGPTWKRIDELLVNGFTRQRIAHEALGQSRIQLRRGKVTVRNAEKIRRYWAKFMTPRGF